MHRDEGYSPLGADFLQRRKLYLGFLWRKIENGLRAVFSLVLAAKTYTYFSTNSLGQGGFSRGTVAADTWTWNNQTTMNGKPVIVRFTMKQVSPDVATYKYEMGAPGEPLKLMMDGKQTRTTLASN